VLSGFAFVKLQEEAVAYFVFVEAHPLETVIGDVMFGYALLAPISLQRLAERVFRVFFRWHQ
jgi:hypothetical protein